MSARVEASPVSSCPATVAPPTLTPRPDAVLLATCLALGSAVLHAGWNLAAKRADGDRFVVLWAQFAVSGAIAAVAARRARRRRRDAGRAATAGRCSAGWCTCRTCGCSAWPTPTATSRSSYPVARGGGAALAAVARRRAAGRPPRRRRGRRRRRSIVGRAVPAGRGGRRAGTSVVALAVAVTIGMYTTIDAQGARSSGSLAYVLATFTAAACTTSVAGLATGRAAAFVDVVRTVLAAGRAHRHRRGRDVRDGARRRPPRPGRLRGRAARVERRARRRSPAGACSARATTAGGSPPRCVVLAGLITLVVAAAA